MITIIIGHATFCIVIAYNNVIARLRRSSPNLLQASADLGAHGMQTFRLVTLPLVANTGDFNRIHRQIAANRSTPCVYIGSSLDSMEPLLCYGVYRDLYITVNDHPTIRLNLEIDGINNS